MSLDTVEKSLVLLRSLPLNKVILIGGEPTVHPDFLTIVGMIKNAGLKPTLITNGIKFKDLAFLKKTVDLGVAGITISLKAFSDEQYGDLTGKRAFEDTMLSIENIASIGVDANVSITIGKELFESVDEMIGVMKRSAVNSFSLEMERPIISENRASLSGESTPQETANFFMDMYPKLDKSGINFVVKMSLPFCLFHPDFIEMLKKKKRIISGCHIYKGSGIIIDPSGKLLPCNHFCNNPLGEIGRDFSTGNGYIDFRKRADVEKFYKTLSSYPHQKCVHCEYWSQCGAGCRMQWLCRKPDELIPAESHFVR